MIGRQHVFVRVDFAETAAQLEGLEIQVHQEMTQGSWRSSGWQAGRQWWKVPGTTIRLKRRSGCAGDRRETQGRRERPAAIVLQDDCRFNRYRRAGFCSHCCGSGDLVDD